MATPNVSPEPSAKLEFASPKFRQLLAVIGMLWVGLVITISFVSSIEGLSLDLTDPLLTPLSYIVLFGGGSLWVLSQYRRHHINLRAIVGIWPPFVSWPRLLGVWITLFVFSLGSFQVLFGLLSYIFPDPIEQILQKTIFLGAKDTAIPWLYNLLMLGILLIAAPILEEFLFRGFLLHRWGTRWHPQTAVILSSLLFGILHSNIIGLTAFGLVMALLYLRSRSLSLVIVVHSLNNAIAAGLELVTRLIGQGELPSLAEFRSSIGVGVLLVVLSTPFLVRFVIKNWPATQTDLPYFAHRDRTTSV